MKMLIIEDEVELLDAVSRYLMREGFLCEQAPDYRTAEDKLAVHEYEIVVLDITLPGGNGLDLLDEIRREHPGTGVLIISARNSLDDKLRGLDLGADDYLTKPFYLAELNSRINAIIRRRNFRGETTIALNEIVVDPTARAASIHGKPFDLTRKEYDLLLYLIVNRNRVLTKEAIAEHLWGDRIDAADNYDFIYAHIKNLRNKIRDAGGSDYVQTVYGVGYKFGER